MQAFVAKCPLPKVLEWPKGCYMMLISKFLSTGILTGSVALKLPQILKLMKAKSVEGLSPEAFYSEVPLTILTVMYNYRRGYPFMSYGENVMVMIQNIILVLLLWKYMKPKPSMGFMISIISLFVGITAICKVLPAQYLYFLPLSNRPLIIYSRMSQIINSYKNSTTGALSVITTTLIFLGGLARVFTTINEVGWDLNLLSGYAIGVTLAGIQLAQVIYLKQ
jgi:uncharacterized protein with PQ loop repeat